MKNILHHIYFTYMYVSIVFHFIYFLFPHMRRVELFLFGFLHK